MVFKKNPHNFFNTNLLFNPPGFYISEASLFNFCWGYEKHHMTCCDNNKMEIALSIPIPDLIGNRLLLFIIILIKYFVTPPHLFAGKSNLFLKVSEYQKFFFVSLLPVSVCLVKAFLVRKLKKVNLPPPLRFAKQNGGGVIARKMCNLTLLFKQHRIIAYSVIPSPGKLHIRKLPARLLSGMVHDKQGCSTTRLTAVGQVGPEKVYHPSVPSDIWTVVLATISMSEKEAITFVLVHS